MRRLLDTIGIGIRKQISILRDNCAVVASTYRLSVWMKYYTATASSTVRKVVSDKIKFWLWLSESAVSQRLLVESCDRSPSAHMLVS